MKADQNYTFTEDISIIQETKLGGRSLIYYWTVPNTDKCDFAYSIINQKKVHVRDFNQNESITRCYMFSMLGDTKITYSVPQYYSAQANKHFYLRVPDNQNYSITVATLNQKYGAFNVSISRFDDLSAKLPDIEVYSVDNVLWWVWTLLFGTSGFIMFILTICMLRRPTPEKDYIYYWGPSQSSLTSTLLGEI
ncbi:hypothetical protein TVAG_237420 [Trichomonas vaginalis G3]|uniref:Uncharacterized protein n=1 Tax=Trichomonas vaginalis (strain ATCC PRA-98 / G3) TaxID=412133 RepID=A2DCU2_TRIV3|nr:hypothetical protein TVAGG3_0796950 [Trichomonas vaginalis G3]EAY21716.1 hypothetical protein TVAG_237420 [Trichomonas vaginalis G3]KAI5496239.1 hypothetical protein TVAGG3_0796950 [Trichomonas vaginalis G3]|eukprot:XP_001582702.1 hypothetical protein [Trichomonas vaginalis G3]